MEELLNMKNRFVKRVLAALCCATMVAGLLSGCGQKKSTQVDNSIEDTKNLKIMIYPKGYSSEWLYAIAEAFEEKYDVNVDITMVMSGTTTSEERKNPNSDIDLFFDINTNPHSLVSNLKNAYNGEQLLRNFTEVANTEIPGEGITLKEKLNDSLLQVFQTGGYLTEDESDDNFYCLPYMSAPMGLYYNETVIDNALGKGKWEIPNTTDELIELCQRLKAKDCHILLASTLDAWTISMFESWWAQYEGYENYMKFHYGIGYNKQKNREEENSSLIFEQPGRLESLKATYDLLAYDNGFILPNTAEITELNLNEYQTKFTLAKNKLAFYPCGDWLLSELANRSVAESDSVIKMMKTPVISSIIESTDSYSSSDAKRLPNITSDEMLSQVVAYVDGVGELPAGVTEEEVAIVKEARSMLGTRADIHVIYAPTFSNAKKLADQFLLFLASDEAIQILKDECIGGYAPYEYEYTNLTGTAQSVYEVSKNATYVANYKFVPLFYTAGASGETTSTQNATIDGVFARPNSITAEELHNLILKTYTGETWQNMLKKLEQ